MTWLAPRKRLHVAVVVLLGILVYANSFNVPFQWDDESYLERNPVVRDLGFFLDPSAEVGSKYYVAFRRRTLTFFTFALNYRLHGYDPLGYHIVNLAIHLCNSYLVYVLVVLLFRTPSLERSSLRPWRRLIALLTAVLFVCHPIQTMAVTYIYQRLASLVTLFYLLSLAAYLQSRLSRKKRRRLFAYGISLAAAVLAMKTKENAVTLPLVAVLLEIGFFSGSIMKRLLRLVPMVLTLVILVIALTGPGVAGVDVASWFKGATRTYEGASRLHYLYTQFGVVLSYLRLLVLPVGQVLIYDIPLARSFAEARVLLPFFFLLALFGFSLYLVRRSYEGNVDLRVLGLGFIWFFVTISPESSIVPLHNAMQEYRVYLPSFGIFLASATAVGMLLVHVPRPAQRGVVLAMVVAVPVSLSATTFARNFVWQHKSSLWQDVVDKSPNYEFGLYNLASGFRQEKKYDEAIDHYKRALELRPRWPLVHNDLGSIYLRQEKLEEAEKHTRIALEYDPQSPLANSNLGIIYMRQDKLEDAEAHFRTALQYDPKSPDANYNLGAIYLRRNELEDAERHFRIALEYDPTSPQANGNLGIIYLRRDDLEEAEKQFRIALQYDPESPVAKDNLGLIYLRQGKLEDAERHFRTALEYDPTSPLANANLGLIYLRQGRLEDAEGHFRTALEYDPESPLANYNLGTIYLRRGKLEEAERQFRIALEYDPGSPDANDNLGIIYLRQDKLEEAEKQFRTALQYDPGSPVANGNLGIIYLRRGKLEDAERHSRIALQRDPESPVANGNLGIIYLRRGELGEAEERFRTALDSDPKSPQANYNLGVICEKRGDTEGARGLFKRALEHDPRFSAAHTSLGILYYGQGWLDKATEHLEKSLELKPDDGTAREYLDKIAAERETSP